ncbi:SMI1/KNR4 family protein [Streptomyces palmae]|uniref:SMI1/KNR4 family protein n=1 Tax=Streptomyces palmae TaxID=1701085 RepID=A0A4Z0GYU9_9ACTN|nr:SMI1/KNR4 family protein [Streptomyces palmae]TGB03247.1 SMI1/KNR4 family protein [Streptomyces palmae]
MDRQKWQPFLQRWSEEWISAHDPQRDSPLDEAVVRAGWLGFAPASAERIAAAEVRLGRALPPSLREFLLVTDGWRDAGCFIYQLAGTAELAWLADTEDADWIEAYDLGDDGLDGEVVDEGAVLRRSLRLSLDGDGAVMLLDPEDVDEHGEWAGYWLASWSGEGPERHASFYELMFDAYAGFHALKQPAGATRDHWESVVDRARDAALAGRIEEPLAEWERASRFGRERADRLRFQLLAMLGDRSTLPLDHVLPDRDGWRGFERDPLFHAELLPLLFAKDPLDGHGGGFALRHLRESAPEPVRSVIDEFEARRREPGFRLSFGNPEFDAAVRDVLASAGADAVPLAAPAPKPVEHDRLEARIIVVPNRPVEVPPLEEEITPPEDIWPRLRDAFRLWRPLSPDHIAPVALLAHPLLARVLTEERGRELLGIPRG